MAKWYRAAPPGKGDRLLRRRHLDAMLIELQHLVTSLYTISRKNESCFGKVMIEDSSGL
jgi:hypothetical protein